MSTVELLTSIETNIIRDKNNRVLSFQRSMQENFRFYYNDKMELDSVIQSDSENISRIKYIYKYYKNGLISDYIVDHNNPTVVLGGVRSWSKSRHDKYQLTYIYDKKGNWIKEYAVISKGKYLNAKSIVTPKIRTTVLIK